MSSSNLSSDWTPERVELLKSLWGNGPSASEIAKRLGGNATRNSVIGKATRLKLAKRPKNTSAPRPPAPRAKPRSGKAKPRPNRPVIIARPSAKVALPPQFTSEPFVVEEGVDLTNLPNLVDNTGCKYVHGDPLGEHGFCGKPFYRRTNWCEHHHHRVYPLGRSA